ncbi:hypothetical protein GCM10009555_031520 [Acrocarpospora macrocephala]|uniref:Uncharacterized protein n=1 Tax=Acrocarpospora macrocephala TaxID=150177 RepID=A0A5M3X164_9ACTN|nr:TIM-barrel domain-containing protein [Acrocarpospora macrocephala]GES12483.1 hypothetical protein Amac_060800 [Acrocarpospora macrocephala]
MTRPPRLLPASGLLIPLAVLGGPPTPGPGPVVDGNARFTVLSPTLIRVEYAGDGAFEDRPTFNAVTRATEPPPFTTTVENGARVIRTGRLTLRYRRDSGPFTPANLSVKLKAGTRRVTARPSFGTSAVTNLGGWRRSLDKVSAPVALNDGLLARDGWYLLDDTSTALLNPDGTITQRPGHGGLPYQDGYLFGYGHDYRRGLKDLRDLTGPAAMLPRWAFGVWFSRYYPYRESDYRDGLLPAFRANRVPLDMLVVDTDWKSPNTWNGWNWNPALFPDPRGFLDWARGRGLRVALNIHPSISLADPKYAQVKAIVGGDLPAGDCPRRPGSRVFDWSDPKQLKAYFELHKPLEDLGVRLMWLDWCCDPSKVTAPGVTPDTWINSRYALRDRERGLRGFAFSRAGGGYGGFRVYPAGPWAEHRYTVHFTGDTSPSWDVLAIEAAYTHLEGNIGMPYVSHDIGGFYARPKHLPDGLYARWVQFGTFQPILRLHSNHGDRLPWEYSGAAQRSAQKFLRLREALVPYTYTLARQAVDTGLPITRGMYLNYPEHEQAYRYRTQYLYGDDVLVAPVTTPGLGKVTTKVWFPPGTWTDYFTGATHTGPATAKVTTDLSTMPVFLRAGGILPTRTDYVDSAERKPLDQVTLTVATGGDGKLSLYEDAGEGPGHLSGESATTAMTFDTAKRLLRIAARRGTFPGAVTTRSWTARFRDADRPAQVKVNGTAVPARTRAPGWTYHTPTRTLTVRTTALPVTAGTTLQFIDERRGS